MTYSDEEIVDTFLDYIRYFSIAHHVPGRIRVKASWLKAGELKKIDERELQQVVERIPGISDYRVNKKALSAVIEYDNSLLPFDLWEEVVAVNMYPVKRDEVRGKLLALLA